VCFIVCYRYFLILGSPLAPAGCLKACFFASFGDLCAGWTQKGYQCPQKSDFGSISSAIWADVAYVLPTFRWRGWDSSLEVRWRLPEDYIEYLLRFLSSDLFLSSSMSVSLSLSLSLFPCCQCFPVSLSPTLPP